ncbi:MAG TPA: glycine--tRNA ligase subunit beta, partial [Firmicutes bacterium]|nr:glycine--tRNA ligase subunit beta [Bacillota bacterium]
MKADFLLEIGCEEIPSRFMEPALAELKKNAQKAFEDARLSYEKAAAFGTPRRLVLYITGLSERQGDI